MNTLITIAIYLVAAIIVGVITLQFVNFKDWLLWCVTKAEEKYGSNTGQLKLQYAYELATTKFKWLTKVIPYPLFKKWIDDALVKMKEMLQNNKKIAEIVNKIDKVTETAKIK